MWRRAGECIRTSLDGVPRMTQGERGRAVANVGNYRNATSDVVDGQGNRPGPFGLEEQGNSPVVPITQMPCTPPSIRKSIKRFSDAWSILSSWFKGVSIGQKMPWNGANTRIASSADPSARPWPSDRDP